MRASSHGWPRRLAALAGALALLALAHGRAHAQASEPASKQAGKDAPARAASGAGDAAPRKGTLRTTQICIDREIADRLAVKRKRRGAVDRLFVKQARHEITAMGGYYSSDLFSGTYVAGGSYTYHMTEDTAVEFGAAMTHANADVIQAIEDGRASILDDDYARVLLVESLLVWSPVYGKLRLGGTIMRFDLNVGAGVGVVDSQTSRGAAGVAGVGMKLFIGKALALRIDARNHVFRQEILDDRFLVNDVAVTTGLSLFLPLRN
jgi:outer membrane beta-barrel protein